MMDKKRITSKFKQTRSANTRQSIVEAAELCFCQKGYFETSVKELAASAKVSVGSFYFYFKDKDELLMEVYRDQNERFIQTISNSLHKATQYKADRKAWLHEFILDLLQTYGKSAKMRSELRVLNYENPKISLQKGLISEQALSHIMKSIENSPMINDLKVKNSRIAILMVTDIVNFTYDRIAGENEYQEDNKNDIIEECFDIVYKYLFL
ncbi:MAG: TetR/AcrR family transcriptional regulator [Clostridiales bacterium]|nr:TetR/AcrR family transcriptional regulator [Clostridiales bacterium]MCI1961943.1 TetR/AcrR family transcriptional regulator [Clostridiales bacterium]MCI2022324.1 TetR/AcrR family transcriptional regulator [Clostridiales bacterium]MCI2026721.1 TetR/AcrR family transcriptional regulator [Clostridiales bacterium]